jgi:hypothetical protein
MAHLPKHQIHDINFMEHTVLVGRFFQTVNVGAERSDYQEHITTTRTNTGK